MIKLTPFQKSITLSLLCLLAAVAVLAGCNRLNTSTPASSDQLERAKRLIEQGNYEAALLELNQALVLAPQDPHVHANLGWLYLYTDDLKQARQQLAKVEELAPDLSDTFYLRGALYSYQAQKLDNPKESRQKHAAAISNYRQALQRAPKNHQLYFDLASSLSNVNQPEEALETLNRGFDLVPPDDLETLVNFQAATCAAHAQMGLFEEAIAECRQALEFTANEESRMRLEGMINNMELMNPDAAQKARQFKGKTKLIERIELDKAEEEAIIDTAVAD